MSKRVATERVPTGQVVTERDPGRPRKRARRLNYAGKFKDGLMGIWSKCLECDAQVDRSHRRSHLERHDHAMCPNCPHRPVQYYSDMCFQCNSGAETCWEGLVWTRIFQWVGFEQFQWSRINRTLAIHQTDGKRCTKMPDGLMVVSRAPLYHLMQLEIDAWEHDGNGVKHEIGRLRQLRAASGADVHHVVRINPGGRESNLDRPAFWSQVEGAMRAAVVPHARHGLYVTYVAYSMRVLEDLHAAKWDGDMTLCLDSD